MAIDLSVGGLASALDTKTLIERKFTKLQILSQAGTSMLAQANQAPQGVPSLLRGWS